jgi:predicted alpha/beta hydrolase family esterase
MPKAYAERSARAVAVRSGFGDAEAVTDLVIVPRWSGDARSDFYPWLERELDEFTAIRCSPLLPKPDAPTIVASVEAWRRTVGAVKETIVLAHSVGCQVTLRALATLDGPVLGCLFVAGWFWVDTPWETLLPWQETPLDFERARANAGSIRVLLSDDDPFTSDTEATRDRFRERLGASVRLVAGAKHFNREQEPEVLDELRLLLGAHQLQQAGT